MRHLLHIGIIVDSLKEAIQFYTVLGFQESPPICLKEFGVTMVEMNGKNICIELAEPIAESGKPMVRGVHHLAFESQDLAEDLERIGNGIQKVMLKQFKPGKVFLPPNANQGGLFIELISREAKNEK